MCLTFSKNSWIVASFIYSDVVFVARSVFCAGSILLNTPCLYILHPSSTRAYNICCTRLSMGLLARSRNTRNIFKYLWYTGDFRLRLCYRVPCVEYCPLQRSRPLRHTDGPSIVKRKTIVATVGSISCGLMHRFGHLLLVPPQQFVKHYDTGENCYKKSSHQMYMADRRWRDSSTSDRCVYWCVLSF